MINVVTEPLNLIGINVGRAHFNGRRQVDDHFVIRCWRDDINDSVTNVDGKIHFCAGKALRAVLKYPLGLGVIGRCRFYELCALYRDISNAFPVQTKYEITLNCRSTVVEMKYRALATLQRFKGLHDELLARLSKHLDGHIIRDAVLINELSKKVKIV